MGFQDLNKKGNKYKVSVPPNEKNEDVLTKPEETKEETINNNIKSENVVNDVKEEKPIIEFEEVKNKKESKLKKYSKQYRLGISLVSLVLTVIFLFVPFINSSKPIDFFGLDFQNLTQESYYIIISFVILAITSLISLYLFFDAVAHYKYENFEDKIRPVFILNFTVGVAYGVFGIAVLFIDLFTSKKGLVTFSYILTILQILILIADSVVKSYNLKDYIIVEQYENEEDLKTHQVVKSVKRPFPSKEQLVYALIFSLFPVAILFVDLFTIYSDGKIVQGPIKGIDFLTKISSFTNAGYRMVSYVFILFLVADIVFFVASLTTFITKRKSFYPVSIAGIVINFAFVSFISMYGLYYKIVQSSVIANIQELLEQFYPGSEVISTLSKAEIQTYSYIVAIVAIVFLIYILVRNPSRQALLYDQLDQKSISEEELNASLISDEPLLDGSSNGGAGSSSNQEQSAAQPSVPSSAALPQLSKETSSDEQSSASKGGRFGSGPIDVNIVKKVSSESSLDTFDACPAFTELDNKEDEYNKLLEIREKSPFKGKDLPSLVKFVVNYAKNSRLHLSYCEEDIAAFVAGLGSTKLTILQGLSGTGKTSLPKIFMEAIYGNCELIEIESSWREKNELLGFYNEFSKMYTPKKFTQSLYKAALNPNVITFIVLDEMNLSRIEYYFSDFLSLMENEEDKRQIKLSNIKLYNIYNSEKHSYSKLVEDHTLKVPSNVWFIGTANRDESTFEISDKVYDRAHTMNFNKRAPAIKDFGEVMNPEFLKYDEFRRMLEEAVASYAFDIENTPVIKDVENLMSPFNIAFGNRIYRQIENFVKIYCSCFKKPSEREFEAIDTILLTKVVMKLENKNIDNRDALLNEFKKLKLKRCIEFISKLSEDF